MLTWAQLGFHQKPIGLLNVDGYYGALLKFLDHTVDQQFVRPIHRSSVLVAHSAAELLDRFERYQPQQVEKWIDRDQT